MLRSTLERYRRDWASWLTEVVGVRTLTTQQRLILEDLADPDIQRVIVKSGHGVGKTFLAACATLAHVCLYKSLNICTSSSQFQVRERLWAEVSKLYRSSRSPLGPMNALSKTGLWFGDKHNAVAVSTNNSNNFQGGHESHILLVFDEAQGVERDIWIAGESMMGSAYPKWLAILNPIYSTGEAFEACHNPVDWTVHTLSCLDHPNVVEDREVIPGAVSRKWVEDTKKKWGEDSPMYQARVLGQFPTVSEDCVLSLAQLEAVHALRPNTGEGTFAALDVARYGMDHNYLAVEEDGRVILMLSWQGQDLMTSCGKLTHVVEEYDIPWENVNVDGNGVGGGIIDRCRELGHYVNDVQFGAGPAGDNYELLGDTEFINRRAELYWATRERVRAHKLSIPKKYAQAWRDLTATKYSFRSDGSLKIEEKEQIRRRLGNSPDAGDAVAMLSARERNARPSVTLVG